MPHFAASLILIVISLAAGAQVGAQDLKKIVDLRPTTYYIPNEVNVSCKGKYGPTTYSGSEMQDLHTPEGKYIATVCKRFSRVLLMEGSAILKDRGAGDMVINFAGKVQAETRYRILDRCHFGEGVDYDLCLLPYHTIAADLRQHEVNEVVFIPAAKGIKLPDGSLHEGYFIIRDTGSAFNGAGAQRVDLFVGTEPDDNNAFQKAGFDKNRPLQAFKVEGHSADVVRENLKAKFGTLY